MTGSEPTADLAADLSRDLPADPAADRPSLPMADPVVLDCDQCLVRSPGACADCVVTVLLGGPPRGVELDAEDVAALDALADGGLVPPLRLVVPQDTPAENG